VVSGLPTKEKRVQPAVKSHSYQAEIVRHVVGRCDWSLRISDHPVPLRDRCRYAALPPPDFRRGAPETSNLQGQGFGLANPSESRGGNPAWMAARAPPGRNDEVPANPQAGPDSSVLRDVVRSLRRKGAIKSGGHSTQGVTGSRLLDKPEASQLLAGG
jgi:hypothetical protein